MFVIEYEPHSSLSYLWRVPAGLWHGSILSRSGASTKPGAIQGRTISAVLGHVKVPSMATRKSPLPDLT